MILSLKENKIDKLTFEDKDIKEFNEGLLHEIKNNLVIDDNVEEITLPTKPIGQQHKASVIKLITMGTIEEKIIELQKKDIE